MNFTTVKSYGKTNERGWAGEQNLNYRAGKVLQLLCFTNHAHFHFCDFLTKELHFGFYFPFLYQFAS